MARPARVSPDRILAAAALEFAARGFAGARVDRIARRARVNKAMLYYHFSSKQRSTARCFVDISRSPPTACVPSPPAIAPPAEKVDSAIAAIAALLHEHAHFPAIMLREVAEGGAHLDRETLTALAAVPRAFGAHRAAKASPPARSAPVHPVVRLLQHARADRASTWPARRSGSEIAAPARSSNLRTLPPDEFVRHLQDSMRRMLARAVDSPRSRASRRPRHDVCSLEPRVRSQIFLAARCAVRRRACATSRRRRSRARFRTGRSDRRAGRGAGRRPRCSSCASPKAIASTPGDRSRGSTPPTRSSRSRAARRARSGRRAAAAAARRRRVRGHPPGRSAGRCRAKPTSAPPTPSSRRRKPTSTGSRRCSRRTPARANSATMR